MLSLKILFVSFYLVGNSQFQSIWLCSLDVCSREFAHQERSNSCDVSPSKTDFAGTIKIGHQILILEPTGSFASQVFLLIFAHQSSFWCCTVSNFTHSIFAAVMCRSVGFINQVDIDCMLSLKCADPWILGYRSCIESPVATTSFRWSH